MAQLLPVPYYKQHESGYCLAACAQMVLAFQGIPRSQNDLVKQLKVKPALGAPTRNIQQLASSKIAVTYEEGSLEQLQSWLRTGLPIIAFVQAGELAYWQGDSFQHAVVVIGLEESNVWLLDPDTDATPIAVAVAEFMLAWSGMDYLYAAISLSTKKGDTRA